MSLSRFVSLVVCMVFGAQAAAAQEIRIRSVNIGDTSVTGFVIPPPMAPTGFYVDVYDVSTGARRFLDRKAITAFDAAGGFTVQLTAPLGPEHEARVGGPKMTEQVVATPPFELSPVLREQLYDGTRIVRGYLPVTGGVRSVRVQVLRSALENEAGQAYVQIKSTTEFDGVGQFTVTLDEPLVAGQVVKAQAFTATNAGGIETTGVTVTDPGSWGRARAYFAGGVIFSKDRDDFSKQDVAISFALDKSWLQREDFRLGADESQIEDFVRQNAPATCAAAGIMSATQQQQCKTDRQNTREDAETRFGSDGGFSFRQLNTFFDARLTALPVVQTETAATSTPAPAANPASTSTTEFRDSRKGALMQIGIYAPLYGPHTSWVHEGAVNSFFLAPLFRFGIQTIAGKGDGTPTLDIEGNPDDVFNFWGAGFGLGHQRLSGTTNQTPELISYLHITWGKAEAFKFRKNPDDPQDPIIDTFRTMVEGRLKIPSTALQIGFDANLGDGHDDIRFVFGTRFDVGEAFSRLRGSQP